MVEKGQLAQLCRSSSLRSTGSTCTPCTSLLPRSDSRRTLLSSTVDAGIGEELGLGAAGAVHAINEPKAAEWMLPKMDDPAPGAPRSTPKPCLLSHQGEELPRVPPSRLRFVRPAIRHGIFVISEAKTSLQPTPRSASLSRGTSPNDMSNAVSTTLRETLGNIQNAHNLSSATNSSTAWAQSTGETVQGDSSFTSSSDLTSGSAKGAVHLAEITETNASAPSQLHPCQVLGHPAPGVRNRRVQRSRSADSCGSASSEKSNRSRDSAPRKGRTAQRVASAPKYIRRSQSESVVLDRISENIDRTQQSFDIPPSVDSVPALDRGCKPGSVPRLKKLMRLFSFGQSGTSSMDTIETIDGQHGRQQTLILFDWDDTLSPTTFIQNVFLPSVSEADLQNRDMVKNSTYSEELAAHAKLVEQVLRCCASLAVVAIVTLGTEDWLHICMDKFFIGVDMRGLMEELGIKVFHADRYSVLARAFASRGDDPCVVAKKAAISTCLRRGFLNNQTKQLNVMSVGDSNTERQALKECTKSFKDARVLCKTVKMKSKPTLLDLQTDLTQLMSSMEEMVRCRFSFDKDLRRQSLGSSRSVRRSWSLS